MKSLIEWQSLAQRTTETSFRKNGRVISVVNVHVQTEKGVEFYVFDFKNPEHEPQMRRTIVRFIFAARIKKALISVTLTAEAWMSKAVADKNGKLPADQGLPSEDPGREEHLIAGAWDASGNKSMASAKITRLGKDPVVDEWRLWPDKFEMWVDRAFIDAEKILAAVQP